MSSSTVRCTTRTLMQPSGFASNDSKLIRSSAFRRCASSAAVILVHATNAPHTVPVSFLLNTGRHDKQPPVCAIKPVLACPSVAQPAEVA